ncbi:MAG: GNAT family N-acetyltransferase [Candidatus Marinimicrobia bacterium]|nr:GNAT family N-acetyltransferase [Candidatus Neomarinimicrobiota bacterium]
MQIKSPTSQDEFEQIFKLNYGTFVEEIPQHMENDAKSLIDKYHDKNNYLIAKKDNEVLGMICYNSVRPFSLDEKLDALDKYLPSYSKIVEVRLFTVTKSSRKGVIAFRLLKHCINVLLDQGFDLAIISGTVRESAFFRKIGLVPFGPLVGEESARFQPMYVTLSNLNRDFINKSN